MLRSYFINREWMLSATAQRVYRTAASLSVALFVLLTSFPFLRLLPEVFVPLVRLAMLAGVLGAATTLVAMEYFFFGFDRSSSANRVLWFLVMLFPLLGAPLYCFCVYSPEARRMTADRQAR